MLVAHDVHYAFHQQQISVRLCWIGCTYGLGKDDTLENWTVGEARWTFATLGDLPEPHIH